MLTAPGTQTHCEGLTSPRCSVIICAYTEERWEDTLRAVASVQTQEPAPIEIILVVDHNPKLEQSLSDGLSDVRIVPNNNARGLSGARNTGVAIATGEIVAFLDDDAIAQPGWLAALTRAYADPRVMGVGGRTEPKWATDRPNWWPEEFDWVVGCTYVGVKPGKVRNLNGANCSFRRDVFAIGGFESQLGRSARNRLPLGAEETEFCIRAGKAQPRGFFVYDDQAVVAHQVPLARQGLSYFRLRCFAEGLSKAMVTKSVGFGVATETERAFIAIGAPSAVLRRLRHAIRGDWTALLAAGAIVIGLTYGVVGYCAGLVEHLRNSRNSDAPMKFSQAHQ